MDSHCLTHYGSVLVAVAVSRCRLGLSSMSLGRPNQTTLSSAVNVPKQRLLIEPIHSLLYTNKKIYLIRIYRQTSRALLGVALVS